MKNLYADDKKPYRSILIGGWELSKSKTKHCHVLVTFNNARKQHQVAGALCLKDVPIYITPKIDCSIHDLEQHHVKTRSKIGERILLQYPDNHVKLEDDIEQEVSKKRKASDMAAVLELAERGEFDKIKRDHPGLWLTNMQKIKAHCKRQKTVSDPTMLEHFWIHGPSGTGKTLSVTLLFPNAYIRDPTSKYYEGYVDQKQIVLSDFDGKCLHAMGINKLKTMCDPSGFNIEIKYGGGDMVKAQIIVTSQYTIDECFEQNHRDWYSDQDVIAVKRRFKEVPIHQWLFMNDLQLKSEKARNIIRKGEYKLADLFEPYNIVTPGPSVQPYLDNVTEALEETNNHLSQIGYIKGNPFPKLKFTVVESSENFQLWRSYDTDICMTMRLTKLGEDDIELDVHPRTPDTEILSDEESE